MPNPLQEPLQKVVDEMSRNFNRRLKLSNWSDSCQEIQRQTLLQYHFSAVSFSFLYLKRFFYIYIVTTASPELRLYRRRGSVTERCRRSLYRRLPSGTPCPRVHFAYSLRQLRVVHHLPTPSILTIDRVTSCRLLEYIRSAATVPRLVTSADLIKFH